MTQYDILGLATTFSSSPPSHETDVLGIVAGIAAPLLAAFVLLLAKQCREAASTAQLLLWVALGLTLISSVGLVTQVSADIPTLVT